MKPVKTEVVYQTPFFEVLAKTMRAGELPYYSLRLPDYIGVLAFTADGRILVVRQHRAAVERYTLELPAGLMDPGEQPAVAAARELTEETAYVAGSIEVLGSAMTDAGRLTNVRWTCLALDCRPLENQQPEEGIEVLMYSPHEFWEAIASGAIDHSLDLAAVTLAAARGKLMLPQAPSPADKPTVS